MASKALFDVQMERQRQDMKWGVQNHKDGTGGYFRQNECNIARAVCEEAFKDGEGTWRHILDEEFCEVLAESDPIRLRKELIQLAAVAVAWAEAIDRRQNGRRHQSEG